MAAPRPRWNHTIEYFPSLLATVPNGARRALDVGCGEGVFARELRTRADQVVAMDLDNQSLALARQDPANHDIDFIRGDLLTHPLLPGSFDFVSAAAVIHHMDETEALARMAALLRPGGSLGVIGLAASRLPADLPLEGAAAAATRLYRWRRGSWETPAPKVWPPPHNYGEVRRLAERSLPGCDYRRRLLWRYTITWTKPR